MPIFSPGSVLCAGITVLFLFFVVGLPLIFIFGDNGPENPTFAVESTVVKAYNLTSDNRLFCIVNLGIRAHNPNPKKHSFNFNSIDMEVKKGKHHKLANDALPSFGLGPGGDTVVGVEAVGLRVGLRRKIAEEVRGDVAAGGGKVNVYMNGNVGLDSLGVTCKNVVVDFSRPNVRVDQRVKCGVSVTSHDSGDGGRSGR